MTILFGQRVIHCAVNHITDDAQSYKYNLLIGILSIPSNREAEVNYISSN